MRSCCWQGQACLQITQGPGNHWQPDWSPDGKYIVYRSEAGEGGLYVIPALGGAGLERQVASFGYHPRWSPNSWQILFDTQFHVVIGARDRFYVVDVDGGAPREVGAGFFSLGTAEVEGRAISAAWHPDGKRISIWAGGWTYIPTIWIVAIADGAATKIEIPPRIQGQLVEVGLGAGQFEGGWDFKFSWAPSGTGIYFERTFRGARNVWRMSIDPRTARAVTLERITTGPGNDTDPSLSPDGKKLAFAAESSHVRAWIFPFDGIRGRITGAGRAVTSAAMLACNNVLSRNGKRLAFVGSLAGKQQLWEKSLPDGPEAPIVALDSYIRSAPRLSSDGTKLAYQRRQLSTGYRQLMIWSTQSRNEEPLTTPRNKYSIYPFDWSPDGNSLLQLGT
ncbi:MAG: hypothetical protein DMG60_18845 [Acidobacteria bacterium]|nr:MAG: hypothetical protein DMG60_18845 [Acidobacteriota bacterium]